jgi:polar amino acid transport system permease protein
MIDTDLLAQYGPKMLWGLWTTLRLVLTATLLGALLALPLALARNAANPVLSRLARGYIMFFRGTPLLAQVFLIYYGAGELRPFLNSIGVWWIFRDAWLCAVLAFTMNTTAYQAEILRGALTNLPKGQREAADALGLGKWTALFSVLLPQALVIALRPLGNELILLLKASAIASVITVPELMQATKLAFSRSFDFQVYIWAAVLYLLMVEAIRRFWAVLERRLTRHLHVRAAAPNPAKEALV